MGYNNILLTYLYHPEQPHDWDEDEDGKWRPPKIPNPAYRGPWKAKVCLHVRKTTKTLVLFHVEIKLMGCLLITQKIKNPNYKGKWKIPWIDNPGKHTVDMNSHLCNVQQLCLVILTSNYSFRCFFPLGQSLKMILIFMS